MKPIVGSKSGKIILNRPDLDPPHWSNWLGVILEVMVCYTVTGSGSATLVQLVRGYLGGDGVLHCYRIWIRHTGPTG